MTPTALRRLRLGSLLCALTVLAAACLGDTIVELTYINETDVELCHHSSLFGPQIGASCDARVKANGKTRWRPECGNAPETNLLTVVLTVREGGRQIYSQTATCQEWIDSGAEITIDEAGGELVVADSLPDE